MIARRGAVPGGRSKSGDDENIAAVPKESLDDIAPVQGGAHGFS
jgi:hypothetical protein